jgi:NADPH:quinone reductase-like Zn-dependent oxidoreductase
MKAIVYTKYGAPEVLKLEEIPKPIPGDHDVLVRVQASAVTFATMLLVKGKPILVRLATGGLLRPKYKVLGSEMAGRVEAVGKKINQFKPGDEVYGNVSHCGRGGFAEYVCACQDALSLKPVNISFEEASTVPETALVALQSLRDYGKIQAGKKVLIYGASGGIGTFAVQIAKSFGAEVTGVCSTRNLELVRSLGTDYVIDYTREDFLRNGKHFDLILGIRGYRSIFDYKRALSPDGIYVMAGGSWSQIFQSMLLGPFVLKTGRKTVVKKGKKLGIVTFRPLQSDLLFMKELIEAGKVKPVIDKCFPLSETADAFRYFEAGHSRGKVVITI